MGLAHLGRVIFGTVKLDKSNDPVAVGLLGAVGVMMVAQHLANLIHQLQFWIRFESRTFLGFHGY